MAEPMSIRERMAALDRQAEAPTLKTRGSNGVEAARKVKRPSRSKRVATRRDMFNKQAPKPAVPSAKPGPTGSKLHEGWLEREATSPGGARLQRRYCVLYDDPYLGIYVGEDACGDKGSKSLAGATTKVTGEWVEVSIADDAKKFSDKVSIKLRAASPQEAAGWSLRIDCAIASREQPPPFDPTTEPPPEPAKEPKPAPGDEAESPPRSSDGATAASSETETETSRAASMPGGGKRRLSFLQSNWGRVSFSSQVVSTGMTEFGDGGGDGKLARTASTPTKVRGLSLFRKRSSIEPPRQPEEVESVSDDENEVAAPGPSSPAVQATSAALAKQGGAEGSECDSEYDYYDEEAFQLSAPSMVRSTLNQAAVDRMEAETRV